MVTALVDRSLPLTVADGVTGACRRKNRRRSNLFAPSRKGGEEERRLKAAELGSGRAIPIKQGYLYKRSQKALNKDWKKKYVAISDDGKLTYHASLHVSDRTLDIGNQSD